MTRSKTWVLWLVTLTFSLLLSCDGNRVFEKNTDMADYIWTRENIITQEAEISDTNVAYNFYVNVRHVNVYPYSNLWLRFYLIGPDGELLLQERREVVLATKEGKWLSDCLGDICDNQAEVLHAQKLSAAGKYTLRVEQLMREEKLPAIMSIGVRVEKAE